jgi:hypothetical protein
MKPILIDYLLSLLICLLISVGIYVCNLWHDRQIIETINNNYTPSYSIEESKNTGKYLGKYKLDTLHSEIYKDKCVPDSVFWFEKTAKDYYKFTKALYEINIADSLFKDTLLCLPIHNEPGYSSYWIDKEKHDTVCTCDNFPSYLVAGIKRYPDSLLVVLLKDEPIYIGKICLIRE